MKKILPVLIIGLMFAFSVKAAEEAKTTVLYKVGDKTISFRSGYDDHDQSVRAISINNKEVKEVDQSSVYSIGGRDESRKIYKTDRKNLVVFYEGYGPHEGKEVLNTWHFFDVSQGKDVLVLSEAAYVNNNFYDEDFIIVNGIKILSSIDDRGCNDAKLAGKNKSEAKKYIPVFSSFYLDMRNTGGDGSVIYTSTNNSPLSCEYFFGAPRYGMDEGPHFVASSVDFRMLGIHSNMSIAYFSASGKGWTAYYAYDIKANKITKTTLAKINKDKIKITLVKKF